MYARYLFHEKGLEKSMIIHKLNSFMEEAYPNYNTIDWMVSIEKYAQKAESYPLCKCEGIWITYNEIQTISQLQNKVLERLAFTLLCLAKFKNFRNSENNNWINYSNGEIYSLACITASAFEKDIKLNQLREERFIEYAKKVNNLSIQILYLDDNSEKQVFISDFRKLGYEWKLLKGEPYIRCAHCNMLVRKTSNRSKYCKSCAKLSALKSKYIWDLNNKLLKSEN